MAGRPARNNYLESPRTKAWYHAVRRAVAKQSGQPEEALKPDEVHRLVRELTQQHGDRQADRGDDSKIWHKYAAGKHSPTNVTNHRSAEGTQLNTFEWLDGHFPGTARAYLRGPASIWAVIEAWSIRDAYKLLRSVLDQSSGHVIPIHEIIDEMTYAESESWYSPHQVRLYWGAEQLSLSACGYSKMQRFQPKLELSMHAVSAGIACARFMDWTPPLERVLTNEACMAWVKQRHGLDLLDFQFCRELCLLPEIQIARMQAGLQDDFYPIEIA